MTCKQFIAGIGDGLDVLKQFVDTYGAWGDGEQLRDPYQAH